MSRIAPLILVVLLSGCGVQISPDPSPSNNGSSFMATTSAISAPLPAPKRIYRAIAEQCELPLDQAQQLEVIGGGLFTYRFYLFTCP